ncbi:MAG: HAD family phosphatase [Trueperaceae bacterium]|nr:MAG: HAD family phosphatase [Trueperaceae bacterium]
MIKAIAFDWGGIFTVGTFDSSAVENLAARYQMPQEKVAETYYPLMEEFEVGAFDLEGFYQRFGERSGLKTGIGTFRDTFLGSVRERPEMFEVLAAIPEHYTVGMLSNNVPVLCDRVRSDPRMKRVEHFLFSNEIGVRKPDAKAFAHLSEALDVSASQTIFVDDNRDNIAAAQELGYHGILLDGFEGFLQGWRDALPNIPLNF